MNKLPEKVADCLNTPFLTMLLIFLSISAVSFCVLYAQTDSSVNDKAKWIQYFDEQYEMEIKKLKTEATSGVFADTNSLYPNYTNSSHYLRECSWQLDALLTMYETTKNKKYLEQFESTANLFFNPPFWNYRSGIKIGQKRQQGWSTARYSISLVKNFNFSDDLLHWKIKNAKRVIRTEPLPMQHLPKYLISDHYQDSEMFCIQISKSGFIEQSINSEVFQSMIEKDAKGEFSLRTLFCAKSTGNTANTRLNLQIKLGNTIFVNQDVGIKDVWDIYISDILNRSLQELANSTESLTIRISNPTNSDIQVDLVHLQQYTDYLLHDANIITPLIKFSTLVRNNKFNDFDDEASFYIDVASQIINKWLIIKHSVRKTPTDFLSLYWPETSCYVNNWQTINKKENSLRFKGQRLLPYNMVFEFVQVLNSMDKYNKSHHYMDLLTEFSQWFLATSNIQLKGNRIRWYEWNYYSTETGETVRPEDVDHARLVIASAVLFNKLYKEGYEQFSFFSDDRFPSFANTFLHQAKFGDMLSITKNELADFQPTFLIDGNSSTDTRFLKYGLNGWLDLTPYSDDIWRVAFRLYEDYIESNQQLTAARQMTTLASIIKYWKE